MGIINAANYVRSTPTGADTADTGLFVIGQDFESYSGKSGALLSGASTLGNDLYFSANFDSMAAAIFDFLLHYDNETHHSRWSTHC